MDWEVIVTVSRAGAEDSVVRVNHSPFALGALPRNDIVLDDPYVSGEHAVVTVSANGSLSYKDVSRNGSFRGGQRIELASLQNGEVISIPPFHVRFSLVSGVDTRQTVLRSRPEPPPERPRQVTPWRAAPPAREGRSVGSPCAERTVVLPGGSRSKLFLEVVQGPVDLPRRPFPVGDEPLVIGRGESADIRLDHPTVSRLHARVERRPDGSFRIEDLRSSNGMLIDGERVSEGVLRPGSRIVLGREIELVLREGVAPYVPGAERAVPRKAAAKGPRNEPEEPGTLPSPDSSTAPLVLRTRRPAEGSILVFDVAGRLDGYTYTELAEMFDRAVDQGERLFVFNFARLEFVDHAGLGVLVKAVTVVDRVRGELRIVGVDQRLRDAFVLSRIDVLLRGRILDDEAAALRDLAKRPTDPPRGLWANLRRSK